jgi:SAM-dependent methyltransferase
MTTPLPSFVCPRCRGPVARERDAYACARCAATYPVVDGIPDFRVEPDPWIGLAADREKGLRLERETAGQPFEAMVRAYWAMTPETPPELADHFIRHVCGAERRSSEWLAALGANATRGANRPWIDLGCGTADIAAAAGAGATVVGIDVAFRWLIVARRRLSERGVPAHLVCCNAEALPFPDASFSRALSLGTLEHCRDLDAVIMEARRVLVPGGRFDARTGNRHSVLRKRAEFRFYWPKSAAEIRHALRRAGFVRAEVHAARMLAAEAGGLPPARRAVVPAYQRLRRAPLVSAPARWWSPMLEATGVAP